MENLYICPVCKKILNKMNNSYVCDNNHVFDISKKGYLNLLLNTDKNSKIPGDPKDCLIARNNFFKNNYYKCILDNVITIIKKYKNNDSFNLLDIGCGEGYYTSNIYKEFKNSNIYGFDIAKDGVNLACNYTKDINWFVANSKNIPIKSNSIDFCLTLFSFVTPNEIERVLNENGLVIQVCALDNHLKEIKEVLYENVIEKKIENKLLPFNLIDSIELNEKININSNEDIINLFKMTPHYYRIKKDNRNNLEQIETMTITINVIINIYKIK